MVVDERDYYDSLIMDHDVEMLVLVLMDEASVVLYPMKTIISKRKRQAESIKNELNLLFFDIQINFDPLV
jgi:hypothetical protein